MKFIFSGHLFRFCIDIITIVTPDGDKYRLDLTHNPDNPFIITKLKIHDYEEDHEQIEFERELKAERIYP